MDEGTTFSSPRFVMAGIPSLLEIESNAMDGGSQDSAEGPKLQPPLVSNMKLPSQLRELDEVKAPS